MGRGVWCDIVATTAEPTEEAPPNPRFPLSYSPFGQISSTSYFTGSTVTFSQIAFSVAAGSRSIGIEFQVDSPAWLHAYRFPRLIPSSQSRPVTARLYRVTGPTSGTPVAGSDATFSLSAAYWQSAHLNPAVQLVPGDRYKAVFHFQDSTPVGIAPGDQTDRLRGPLRVLANTKATGGATMTAVAAPGLTYPTEPAAFSTASPVVDLYVSEENPGTDLPTVRSVFDRRRPGAISYQGWGSPASDPDVGVGFTAGMEFYVTTATCFLRGYRYWRAPYPAVTQVGEFRLYRVTGTQAGTYFPGIDADYDVTTGTLIAGTTITVPEWTTDPNQTESYAEGWITHLLSTPVPLTQGERYRIAAWYPYRTNEASRPATDFFWLTGPGGAGIVRRAR